MRIKVPDVADLLSFPGNTPIVDEETGKVVGEVGLPNGDPRTGRAIRILGKYYSVFGSHAECVAFANGGMISAASLTFSGAATGTRYFAALNGIVYTNGGGATYFPGNAAGATATGGQYN